MTEDVLTNGVNASNAASSAHFADSDREAAIRRYMQIQREIAQLELEKEQLRGLLVQQLEGVVPARWHIAIDEKPLLVVHEYKTSVRYDEKILSERLGERYSEILEIDGTKIRKNRDLVRPLLAPVLDKIGTPSASRVKAAVQSGSLTADDFRGAFKKTLTPYISISQKGSDPSVYVLLYKLVGGNVTFLPRLSRGRGIWYNLRREERMGLVKTRR